MTGASPLLLVGGGRWARVYLSILSRLNAPIGQVFVASEHGGERLAAALQKANSEGVREFTHVRRWQDVSVPVSAALVVNAAFQHVPTASALLEAGVCVLIEKPAALNVEQAEALAAKARAQGRLVRQALALNYCEYLQAFVRAARAQLGPLASIDIRWKDAAEIRYGETKAVDFGLGLADDVGPHIAALLAAIGERPRPDAATIARGGLDVCISGEGSVRFSVSLSREAIARERLIILRDTNGKTACLNFAVEPGTIEIGFSRWDADPGWPNRLTPLTLQLLDFLRHTGDEPREADLIAIMETAMFSAGLADRARVAQRLWLASDAGRTAPSAEKSIALRELLAPHFIAAGLVPAGDNQALEAAVTRALSGDTGLASMLRAAVRF